MLLGVVSTNGRLQTENVEAPQAFAMRRAWMLQDCACRMSHNIRETRRGNVTATASHGLGIRVRFHVHSCIRARLWKNRFDCSGGGVSLDRLGWIFPMQTSCPFRQRHYMLQQTLVSDKYGIRLPATTDCFAGRINPVSTICPY